MKFPVVIPAGLVSDDTTFMAEGGAYDCSGVRCWEDQWQQLGGYESVTFDLLTGVCRSILPWTDNDGVANAAFGLHNGLKLYQSGGLFDITPVDFVAGSIDGSAGSGFGAGTYGSGPYGEPTTDPTYPLTWAFSTYGQSLIANARRQKIWQWSNVVGTPAVVVSGAPTEVNYALVVPQRQLIAFGCTDLGGDYDPMCIRGSDIENITSWTPTTANNAFEYVLDSGSFIVTARAVANYLFVWTDTAFYLGTFIGAPDETWRFERQGLHCGAIGVGAPVIQGQTALWPSPDAQFWNVGIGGEPQPIPCPIQKAFADNLAPGQEDKIVGVTCSRFKEVRWFYADNRDGYEISRSVAVNMAGQWSRDTSQPRTAYADAGASPWPIATTYAGNIYYQELGATGDGAALSGFLETADFYLGDAEGLMQVNGCWPDFKDQQGTITRYLKTRLYPQDTTERVKGPYRLTPDLRKKDFRATGRVARIRDEWSGNPSAGRWGKQTFDVEPAGLR